MVCEIYNAMLIFSNSKRILGVAYFSQCIISKEIIHTIKQLPVPPEVCVCVCVRARARVHNDTVDCSDYTAVIYHLENQMLRQVPHLSTFLPCTRFNKIFSFKSHCKTISVLQLLNMNLILNQLADFHMTRAFGQMWPSLKVRQPLSRAL